MVNNIIFFLICCIGADDVGGDQSGGGIAFGEAAKKHGELLSFNQIQELILLSFLFLYFLKNMIWDRRWK